jgi:hypothetical protein
MADRPLTSSGRRRGPAEEYMLCMVVSSLLPRSRSLRLSQGHLERKATGQIAIKPTPRML